MIIAILVMLTCGCIFLIGYSAGRIDEAKTHKYRYLHKII